MSLASAMSTGISGLGMNAEAISVVGNNISNTNTAGFKGARTVFSDLLSATISGGQVGRGGRIQTVQNLFSQGSFENTQSVSDLAIQGNSFFALAAPSTAAATNQNDAYLTRAGSFLADNNYNLVNPDGYAVLEAATGLPIKFAHVDGATAGDFSKITGIDTKGVITYLDVFGNSFFYTGNGVAVSTATSATYAAASATGAIAIVNPVNTNGLTKVGGTLFKCGAASGVPAVAPTAATNSANGTSEIINSSSLEISNVDMATELVNLIKLQRAYSGNSKTITTADQMMQETLQLKQ